MITVEVDPNDERGVRLLVTAAPDAQSASKPITFFATGDGPTVKTPTVFMTGDPHGPG